MRVVTRLFVLEENVIFEVLENAEGLIINVFKLAISGRLCNCFQKYIVPLPWISLYGSFHFF